MPKKIDYVVLAPVSTHGEDGGDTPEEESSSFNRAARSGPGGPRRPIGRGGRPPGGARPNTGFRGPGGNAGGGFRRPGGPGGGARPGPGGGAATATSPGVGTQRPRGFGGMSRLAPVERPTPRVELPPFMTVKELAD